MKRLFFIIPIAMCCAMPACKKAAGPADGKSVQPNNNLDSTIAMNALINGKSWAADSAFGYYVKFSGNDSGVVNLELTGSRMFNDTSTTITFNITNYTGPATYTINPPTNTATYYVGNLRNYALTGALIIASDTAYSLRGTYYFIANTDTITNGTFNVALP